LSIEISSKNQEGNGFDKNIISCESFRMNPAAKVYTDDIHLSYFTVSDLLFISLSFTMISFSFATQLETPILARE
jgi:hypothetical protein